MIHRIAKQKDFAVIQGGQKEVKNDKGENEIQSKSAFYVSQENQGNIPDELWKIKPEFATVGENNVLTNKPEFTNPNLYKNFNPNLGTAEYSKGLILMAKTSSPDSASSQFFITLDKTILPAQYTVFGVIDPSSYDVLDKINKEVSPVVPVQTSGSPAQSQDGKPNKEIKISEIKIIDPKL
jgi:cyclophilin family peptidyl-prolyl cis-trans isomerase